MSCSDVQMVSQYRTLLTCAQFKFSCVYRVSVYRKAFFGTYITSIIFTSVNALSSSDEIVLQKNSEVHFRLFRCWCLVSPGRKVWSAQRDTWPTLTVLAHNSLSLLGSCLVCDSVDLGHSLLVEYALHRLISLICPCHDAPCTSRPDTLISS
ncbi:hypothetical protein Mapa_010678 [Marchantia paleacea]|nr:hypothetical protein Mapa_010678 [Marchantia paleacea]